MRTFTLALIFGFTLVAWSQERITKVVPRTYSLPIPQLEKGKIEGRTYRNPSIGLEFTPSVGLAFGTPELNGTPGTVPLMVTVAAWGEQKLLSAKEGVFFYAEALAYYPDNQQSTEAYIRKVVRGNRQEGFEPVGKSLEAKLGGVSFSRTDFKKWPVYEAVLVKACAIQVFVFIIAGSDQDAVNRLINGTELKVDNSRSGCGLPTLEGGRPQAGTQAVGTVSGDGVYSVGGDVSPPVPIHNPDPTYPEDAGDAKYQGHVVLSIVIDASGTVTDCKVVKSLGHGLDEKTRESVRTWKFKPAMRKGSPVSVRIMVDVPWGMR
jgi:TonB family protein